MSGKKVTKYTIVSNGKVFRIIDAYGNFLIETRDDDIPIFRGFTFKGIQEFSGKSSAETWIKDHTWLPV